MKATNIEAPQFSYDPDDPAGYRAGMARPGPIVGAEQLGATVYDIPPAQSIFPNRHELAEEEWLIVLEGTPSLRDPDSDKIGVYTAGGADNVIVRRSSNVDYYDGER